MWLSSLYLSLFLFFDASYSELDLIRPTEHGGGGNNIVEEAQVPRSNLSTFALRSMIGHISNRQPNYYIVLSLSYKKKSENLGRNLATAALPSFHCSLDR